MEPEPGWTTIVGIAPNIRQSNFRDPEPDPVAYQPYRADAQRFAMLMVRTMGDPAAVTASIREAMRARSNRTCRSSTRGQWRNCSHSSDGPSRCSDRCSRSSR